MTARVPLRAPNVSIKNAFHLQGTFLGVSFLAIFVIDVRAAETSLKAVTPFKVTVPGECQFGACSLQKLVLTQRKLGQTHSIKLHAM